LGVVLHPGLKLEYFRHQRWEEEWIETAENLTCEKYLDKYEKKAPANEDMSSSDNGDGPGDFSDDFGNVSVAMQSRRNEIDEYLALPVVGVKDPLKWWTDNRAAYPNLSRMALDYLSIPGKYCTFMETDKV
jgi:hypothetical protein